MEKAWGGAKDAAHGVSMDMSFAERSGGAELHHVEEATDSQMLAVLQAKHTKRWLCVSFDVDPDPPHDIRSVLVRPTDPPPEPLKEAPVFDEKARNRAVQALVRELNRSYVFPDKAAEMDRQLNARLRQHTYDAAASRLELAHALTEDMQGVTHDKHLHVEVSCSRTGARASNASADLGSPAARQRIFGKTERLAGNVAYVEIATFGVPATAVRDEVRDTMSQAADASAIIFDVRHNGGGEPETVALVASYVFGNEPVHLNSLYWRIPDRTDDFYTDPRVQGTKFGPTKPVYVLTSSHTFSAAEEFTYDLQTRKRATIVGETTGGGAHPGDMVSLPFGFTVFVPNGRAINPVTHTNWEGTGVKPDVAVPAAAALETAQKLAREQAGGGAAK
jgi:retinol-binding protein 3